MKKHWLTATTLGAIAALSLTACSSSDDDQSKPSETPTVSATAPTTPTETGLTQAGSDADVDALKSIAWTDKDEVPALAFDFPLTVETSAALVLEEGDGEDILAGNNVTLDYTISSGVDGSSLFSTYDTGIPETFQLNDGRVDPSLYSVLVGGKVGQEFIYGVVDTQAQVAEGEDTPAIFMAITVSDTAEVAKRASGTAVEPVAGLPTVTLADDGAPSVDFADAEMSTELVAQTLIEGEGAEVTAGQTIIAHYTGWIWDGETFDSSWANGAPLTISLAPGSVIQGWTDGLVGQKVGSQVLLVIPPELGYGDKDNGAIPADSTLVFVVDILAAS